MIVSIYYCFISNIYANSDVFVHTDEVHKGIEHVKQRYVGSLYYDRHSNLASQSEGSIETIYVTEGMKVSKGDKLLQIDSSKLQASILAKKATLTALSAVKEMKKKELKRSKVLLEKNSMSQSNYEEVFYTYKKLSAEMEAVENEIMILEIEREKKSVKAPYDGLIVSVDVDIGEWVSQGSKVATLVDPKSIEAHLNISSELYGNLPKSIKFDATIHDHPAVLTLKSAIALAEQKSRSFTVEFNIESNIPLIEGMPINVIIPKRYLQNNTFTVPRDAVIKRFGEFVVFIIEDGVAKMIPVKVLGYAKNYATVTSPQLREYMRVITKGNERIFPGSNVKDQKDRS